MGKSKAALPDLTKVIALKMDFTAVSSKFTKLAQGELKGTGRGNLVPEVSIGTWGITGGFQIQTCHLFVSVTWLYIASWENPWSLRTVARWCLSSGSK
jgi:hypothetical protein